MFDLILKILGIAGWVCSALLFLMVAFRRTLGWDRGNLAFLFLHGDKDSKSPSERKGYVEEQAEKERKRDDDVKQLREIAEESLRRAKAIQDGFGAYGSKSDQIAAGVRKSVAEMAEAAHKAQENRRRLTGGQFWPEPRDDQSFPTLPERDSAPALPPRDPRREPDDMEDTGNFNRGRRRR